MFKRRMFTFAIVVCLLLTQVAFAMIPHPCPDCGVNTTLQGCGDDKCYYMCRTAGCSSYWQNKEYLHRAQADFTDCTSYTCPYCDTIVNSPIAHTKSDIIVPGDGDKHTYICSVCSEEVEEDCYGGTATPTSKAICEGCGEEYGNPLGHTYENAIPSDVLASPATCVSAAMYYIQCDTCEEVSTSLVVAVGEPLGHDASGPAATCEHAQVCARRGCSVVLHEQFSHWFGDWTSNGDGTHTAHCKRSCDYSITVPCEECGDDTLSACPVCGGSTFALVPDVHTHGVTLKRGEIIVRGADAPKDGVLYAFTVSCEHAGNTEPFSGTLTVSLPLDIADAFTLTRADTNAEIPYTYKNSTLTFKTDAAGLYMIIPKA